MKIEKVNDNQIRCTLTKEDLEDRQLKLSELAYGTEKAKDLFRDMMQQAAYEFGFEAEDIPLMIEAIPLSSECIILIITKVEYPEELDTRFSRFSPSKSDEGEDSNGENTAVPFLESADDILGLFDKIKNQKTSSEKSGEFIPLSNALSEIAARKQNNEKQLEKEKVSANVEINITKLYVFNSLAGISRVAAVTKGFYQGENSLFKNSETAKYYLFLKKSKHSPEDFNKLCNIFSEYASQERFTPAVEAFYEEHCEKILSGNALQVMADL